MGVPSGDERDFEFARELGLPIVAIQRPPDAWFAEHGVEPTLDTDKWPDAYVGEAEFVNSANADISINGARPIAEAKRIVTDWLVERRLGFAEITYKLRDWLFSRQRYWGEPFPIVWDEIGPVALPEDQLPVLLPPLDDFAPTALDPNDGSSEPVPPLARAADWRAVALDLGDGPRTYQRELNVMPQWAGSCWYYLRYLDPTNEVMFVDPEVERYWMVPDPDLPDDPGGVDLYVGGVEHAVLHLLYARFWHKVLFDLGYVSSPEPFRRLYNQGYIQAYAYRDPRGQYVDAEQVVEAGHQWEYEGRAVERSYGKMGKSLKNVVTPDEICAAYGADTFRLYEMGMGPLDTSRPWSTASVVGMYRFLQRVWRNIIDEETGALRNLRDDADEDDLRLLHATIDAVTTDMAELRFNTAIARLIELNNHVTKEAGAPPRPLVEAMVLMLAPLCPHVAEELWSRLGHTETIVWEPFPEADPAYLQADTVTLPVQINGKVRSEVVVAVDAGEAEIQAAALADPKVAAHVGDQTPKRVIVVPGRMVSIVL
jgi:leucyl-tRNA synthetase